MDQSCEVYKSFWTPLDCIRPDGWMAGLHPNFSPTWRFQYIALAIQHHTRQKSWPIRISWMDLTMISNPYSRIYQECSCTSRVVKGMMFLATHCPVWHRKIYFVWAFITWVGDWTVGLPLSILIFEVILLFWTDLLSFWLYIAFLLLVQYMTFD